MATTRIIPMHHNKGKPIAACIQARTDYAKNPDKTEGGSLVTTFECDPQIVHSQFLLAKREYKALTGREQERDVIAYQVRQSFRPGEISPEDANRIGYAFAERFLKSDHAFLVATHVDKKHIHNHIVWNSTSLNCTRKFRNFWGSTKAVRCLSDMLCVENGLSIVENPKRKGMHYGKWLGNNAKPSHRGQIRATIDTAMREKPKDILALLESLKASGYEIKQGKIPALRGKDQKRFVRLDTLGEGYAPDDLQAVFDGKNAHTPRKQSVRAETEKPVQLLVDIQAALSAGKGAGYERWAKVFNLKQMAQTMNYLTEHALTDYDALTQKTKGIVAQRDALLQQIKEKEKRISEVASLRTHIIQYIKTRDVYVDYRKNGYSKEFFAAHEADILLHKAAKAAFDKMGLKKLPTVTNLNNEYKKLLAEKKKLYADYRIMSAEMKSLLVTKHNVDQLLGMDSPRQAEPNRNPAR